MIRSVALALLAAVALVGGLRLLAGIATTDFRVVRVEGELTPREREEVRAAVAAGLERPGGGSVADVVDVVEGLGWVREVRARRHWPDALHVAVRRETPVARWGKDAWLTTSGAVVSSDQLGQGVGHLDRLHPDPGSAGVSPALGELLVTESAGETPALPGRAEMPPALAVLPTIAAARANGPQAMEIFNRISSATAAEGLRLVALTENNAGDWSATFADGVQVMLGRTALRERTERFAAVYRAHLRAEAQTRRNATPEGALARADARYANGVAVRWVAQVDPAAADETPPAPAAPITLAVASATPPSSRARLVELGFVDGE